MVFHEYASWHLKISEKLPPVKIKIKKNRVNLTVHKFVRRHENLTHFFFNGGVSEIRTRVPFSLKKTFSRNSTDDGHANNIAAANC